MTVVKWVISSVFVKTKPKPPIQFAMCRKKKKSWWWWEWEVSTNIVTAEITDKIWSLNWTLEWHYQRLEEEQHHQSLRGGTSSKTGGGANRLVQAGLHVRKGKYHFCFMFLFWNMEMTRTVHILWKRKSRLCWKLHVLAMSKNLSHSYLTMVSSCQIWSQICLHCIVLFARKYNGNGSRQNSKHSRKQINFLLLLVWLYISIFLLHPQ